MGFLSGLFETKANVPDPIERATGSSPSASFGGFGIGGVGDWDIDKAVNWGLEKVVWVARACDVIATNQANLAIKPRKSGGMNREDGEWIEDKNLWNLLNVRANSYERAWQFRYRLSVTLLLARRGAFIEVIRDAAGRPTELHLLPPGTTMPIPDPKTFVSGYHVYEKSGGYAYLPPENVIWLRLKPHPTDPYAQMTPLMAAGISAETDWLANIFNRNFLANDGRPGMLIGIQGQINPIDAAEIKARFSGGPMRAGQVSVIESDGIDIADMSSTPRDVQWTEMLAMSKERLLMAFGVPESIMGNASGRTFDNADAERENFWMDTEKPHCDNIAASLDLLTGDINDDIVLAYDYSVVDVLQRAARTKREELRGEVAAGLRTPDEYRLERGLEEWGVPGTRALWHPLGVLIGKTPADQKAIDALHVVGPAQPADPGQEGGAPFAQSAPQQIAAPEARQIGNLVASRALALTQRAEASVTNINDAPSRLGRFRRTPTRARTSYYGTGSKSDEIVDAEVVEEKGHPYDILRSRMEGLIEGVVLGWDERQEKVITDRLVHVKSRKGTRHWDGEETTEQKALDPSYSVDVQQWAEELRSTLRKSISVAVAREAQAAARDMRATGVLDRMDEDRDNPVDSNDLLIRAFGTKQKTLDAMNTIFDSVDQIIQTAAQNQSRRVMDLIHDMDAEGKSMRQIQIAVRKMIGQRAQWRKALSVNIVTTAVEGAREAVYRTAGGYYTKTWHAEDDEKTRATHKAADGQVRAEGQPFNVGGFALVAPGDPSAPPQEVIACRCWADHEPSDKFYDETI